MTDMEIDEINTRQERAKASSTRNTRSQYWWTGLTTFQSVVDYVHRQPITQGTDDLVIRLRALYKLACSVLHSNCFGNHLRLGLDADFVGIDTTPLTEGHEFALEFTATTLIFILGTVCEEFGFDHKPYTAPLNELVLYYRNQTTPAAT